MPNIADTGTTEQKRPLWNKYLYISDNQHISLNYLLGLFSLAMLFYGYYRFFTLNWVYAFVFLPLAIVVFSNKLLTLFCGLIYPRFSTSRHRATIENFWLKKNHPEPSIDVFLPICGESVEVIEQTWQGVKDLNYSNFQVYVLDDYGDDEAKILATKFGFYYLSRGNKGEYKKAGNLQFGLENSTGEHILILDADFVPASDFLKETIPYMQNEKLGLLQTPQYFELSQKVFDRSIIEYGAGAMVEDFYRIVMPCRNYLGGAMCVGTSAIYRRQALLASEGFPKVEDSEDIRTGLGMMEHGFELKYLPVILSRGVCPDNVNSYLKQQIRWCTGSIETVFSGYFYKAKMSSTARIVYLAGILFYFAEAFGLILSLHIWGLIFFNPDKITLLFSLLFVPFLIYNFFLENHKKLFVDNVATLLVGTLQAFAFLYAIPKTLLKVRSAWIPAGRVTKISSDARNIISMIFAYTILYIGLFFLKIIIEPEFVLNYQNLTVMIWLVFTIASLISLCLYCSMYYLGHQKTIFKYVFRPKSSFYLKFFRSAFGLGVLLVVLPVVIYPVLSSNNYVSNFFSQITSFPKNLTQPK